MLFPYQQSIFVVTQLTMLGHSRVNRTHSALLVILNRLPDFSFGVHHKWPIARDWFVQGHAGDEQYFKRSLRVCRIFDSHFVAVLREQNRSEEHTSELQSR